MDRRFAAIAGVVLAGAGAIGMFGRRHAPATPAEPMTDQAPLEVVPTDIDGVVKPENVLEATAEPTPEVAAAMPVDVMVGWNPGMNMLLPPVRSGAIRIDPSVVFFRGPQQATAPARPLVDMLKEAVSGYPIGADKMLMLSRLLGDLCPLIEADTLEEGTVLVPFDWLAGGGIIVNMELVVLTTRNYARISFCDVQGQLHSPALDVFMRGGEMKVEPNHGVRHIDLEELRSEAAVTSQKIRALDGGGQVHPGSARSVMTRCGVTRTPFDG